MTPDRIGVHPLRRTARLPRWTLAVLAVAAVLASACAPAAPTVRPVRGGEFVVPATIDASGRSDVTAALNAWMATVPDGSTISFRGGTYLVDSPLYLADRRNLRLDGEGATFLQATNGDRTAPLPGYESLWPRERSVWIVEGGTGLEFTRMHVVGPADGTTYLGQRYEEQAGWHVYGTAGLTISWSSAVGVLGDFVALQGRDADSPAGNIVVSDNTFARAGRNAVSITNAVDVEISRNRVTDTARSLFNVEPPTPLRRGERIAIHHNEVSGRYSTFFGNLGAGTNVHDVSVTDNTTTGLLTVSVKDAEAADAPPGSARRGRYRITGNVSTAPMNGGAAIFRFTGVDDVIVSGNTQELAGLARAGDGSIVWSGQAVEAKGVQRIVVRDNRFAEGDSTHSATEGVMTLSADATTTDAVACDNVIDVLGAVDAPCR